MNISTTARRKISEALAPVIDAANEARSVPNPYLRHQVRSETHALDVFAHTQQCGDESQMPNFTESNELRAHPSGECLPNDPSKYFSQK